MSSPAAASRRGSRRGRGRLRGSRGGGRCARAVAAVVQPGEGALDDPTVTAEPGAVRGLAARDHRLDCRAARRGGGTCRGRSRGRRSRWRAVAAADRREPRTGGTRSSSVSSWVTSLRLPPVSVQASGMPPPSTRRCCLLPRRPLSTGLGTRLRAPFFACTWLESAIARDHSISPAACSSARSSCVQPLPDARLLPGAQPAANRSMPQPKPSSCGRCSQPIPVCSTNKIPCNASRSVERLAPRIAKTALSLSAATARSAPTTHPRHPTASPASTPTPTLTTDADRLRDRQPGPFIQLELLSLRPGSAAHLSTVQASS